MSTRRAMRHTTLLAILPVLVSAATSAGCASAAGPRSSARVDPTEDTRFADAVLTAADVQTFITPLAALTARVPSVRVARGSDCPAVSLTPRREPDESTAPLVYVDGAPTIGTCTLVHLSPSNIERIEVYSTGGKSFASHENGLILIVTKRG
jgi:hypothetical protein